MPKIIDYPRVVAELTAVGAICNYHNSGSFGLDTPGAHTVGWLVEDDSTIRPAMRQFVSVIDRQKLMPALSEIWSRCFTGVMWVMPASHWAYELTYGNANWLPQRLRAMGVDPDDLRQRNDGSAIAFEIEEAALMNGFVADLLTRSAGSDFTAAWPGHDTVAMLHHHQQIWWRTTDAEVATALLGYSAKIQMPAD